MTHPILILGASSPIARAAAAAWAQRGYPLYLAGRDDAELRRLAADIAIRYHVQVWHESFDAELYDTHNAFFAGVIEKTGGLSGVLLAFGYLGNQLEARHFAQANLVISRNFTGAVSILSLCASYFEERGCGFIAAISSVAGDRGRQSNYVYGAAKGALTLFLQGLRNRLHSRGVKVITIKPGFVDTSMTFGMPGIFLVASPDYVGEKIVRAVEGSRNVVYIPWFWRIIMAIIRLIPESIFMRLKL